MAQNDRKSCIIFTHMEPVNVDSKILIEIVRTKMPFGKYKGTLIADLPVYYLEWLHNKGFPPGKLGMMLGSVYEIKINGLNSILTLVRKSLAGGKTSY
jgi:uncharacterized protein (DUF3820 family)